MTEKKILRMLGDTSNTKLIPSKKFPGIRYAPGEDVWVTDLRKNKGQPLSFDLSMELTANKEAVELAATALDNLDRLETSAHEYLKEIAADPAHACYEALRTYFDLHGKTKPAGAEPAERATTDGGHGPRLEGFIDQLTLERLGGATDKDLHSQVFIMDFSFTQRYGETILAVYLDNKLRPFEVAIES